MSEILTDGVHSVTTNGMHGIGYDNNGFHNGFVNGRGDVSDAWRVDNHGAERTAEVIEAMGGSERAIGNTLDDLHVAVIEASRVTDSLVSNGFMQTRTDAIQFANQARTDTLQSKYEVLLDSTKNASASLAALAACCCELKERISAEGQATRDLINANEALKNATELAQLKLEIALSKGK